VNSMTDHCEAADVDMELVQARIVAITRELSLELQLVSLDWLATDRAWRTDTRPAPGPVGSAASQCGSLLELSRAERSRRAWCVSRVRRGGHARCQELHRKA
jgi:hypothetical protein